MEPTNKPKISAKDLFINLGAFVALYTVVFSLINLLFTVINKAYPQVNAYYSSSANISWPVSIIIIFFPILVLMYWLLEKQYVLEPDRQRYGVHKWLSYITLFLSGFGFAGDLVAVLYYFLNGEELTTGFLLKVFVVLVITASVFTYFVSDIRGRLNSRSRNVWRVVATLIVLGSIVWGFSVLGSPRTQRLYKYDDQKIIDLQNINSSIQSYYTQKGSLPTTLDEVSKLQYTNIPQDGQYKKPYEYHLVGQGAKAYQLCADFNKESQDQGTTYPYYAGGEISWKHEAGHKCFDLAIPLNMYVPVPKGV
jgi:hypothetical protein